MSKLFCTVLVLTVPLISWAALVFPIHPDWTLPPAPYTATTSETLLEISASAETPVAYPNISTTYDTAPGKCVWYMAEAFGEGISDGVGAYLSIEFTDASGKRVSFNQSAPAPEGEWATLFVEAIVPANSHTVWVRHILNGHGTARFRPGSFGVAGMPEITRPGDGIVHLVPTPTPLPHALVGFGFEDDGWAYDQVNRDHGMDDAALALREERIREMDPDWVRMFFWHREWNPSGDGETFTWDSDGMQSHYRTLALYEDIGATVNVTGVEWGIADPFGKPEVVARAWTALMQHLIVVKGFTCVRQWTLTNEPNSSFVPRGGNFAQYVALHRLVKAGFDGAGLNIQMVGSDDTNGGWPWFRQCLLSADYDGLIDLYASHRYFQKQDMPLATRFFRRRLDTLAQRKPLVIAEFGFHDARTKGAMINPVMEDYDYALWTADFTLNGLNEGVAGFSIWCAHEMYYPFGHKMNYGLWNFPDRNSETRPVYVFWKLLTQCTEAGDTIVPVVSSHPGLVRAVRVGDDLFFVNSSEHLLEIQWSEAVTRDGVVYAQSTLPEGSPVTWNELPPKSFGHATLENP